VVDVGLLPAEEEDGAAEDLLVRLLDSPLLPLHHRIIILAVILQQQLYPRLRKILRLRPLVRVEEEEEVV
jgi:hypothetical protein